MEKGYVLSVKYCYHTMDMSVANSGEYTKLYGLDELSTPGFTIKQQEFSNIEVLKADENSVILKWCRVEYEVPLDKEVVTEWVQRDNPYLSLDEACFKFYFSKQDFCEKGLECVYRVGDIHERYGTWNSSLYHQDKEMALFYLKSLCDKGLVSYIPLYALYKTVDNWCTAEIVRFEEFHSIMKAGIEDGCLSPEDPLGWLYFKVIVEMNEDKTWKGYNRRYYNLVKDAAEAGVEDAIEILEQYGDGDRLYEEPVVEPSDEDFVLKIRSCEDTIYFTPEDLGYKYNTYYYNLKELSPGMVIHKNEAYPPIEIVDISRNKIKAKFKGDIYEVALGKCLMTGWVSSDKSDGNELWYEFTYSRKEDTD